MVPTATKVRQPTKVFATSSTSASITDPVPTITEPTGEGIVDLKLSPSDISNNYATLIPFGVGTADQAGTLKVVRWYLVGTLWIPVPILTLTVTLGTSVGVAGAALVATDKFCDTIALSGSNNVPTELLTPGDNTIAQITFDTQGASKLQVLVAKGTTTSLNALFRGF